MGLRRCVISLATSGRGFPEGLLRLERSLEKVGFDGEFLSWPPGSFPTDCPSQLEVPFAFKPYCFQEARQRGMQLVLWLDSSCVPIRPLDAIFDAMDPRGYIIFKNGDLVLGEWASDLALETLGLTREQALTLPEANTAAIGLNVASETGVEFLVRWHEAAKDGLAFRGVREPLCIASDYSDVMWNRSGRVSRDRRVRGHRHDQTVAGILVHQLGLELTIDGLQNYRPEEADVEPGATILNVRRPRLKGLKAARNRLRRRARDTRLGRLVQTLRRARKASHG
jgi:hypothetical protein